MRHRPKVLTVLTPFLAAAACFAATSPVAAQQTRPGEVMGMRYLSWSGKAETPVDGLRRSEAPTQAPIAAVPASSSYAGIQTVSRPSRYGAGLAGLTSASVWTGTARSAAPKPTAQVLAQPVPMPRDEAQLRAMPEPQQPVARVTVAVADQPAPVQQQAQSQQQADAGPPAGFDPMAPRRDAPIFRMQQPGQDRRSQPAQQSEEAAQQAVASQGEIQQPVLTQPTAARTYSGQAYAGAEPPRESARYYSVHRAGGHQPDPIAMPVSVYLDNAPIDLAEPPAAPVATRTINGRAQVMVPNQDPSLP